MTYTKQLLMGIVQIQGLLTHPPAIADPKL
jgi:hypothetical protein